MFCVLIEVLCGDSIAARRRLPREGNVTFKDLMRGAPDLDIRTVTIVGLTSARYLLPITMGIVTVFTSMRSAGLSWSHDTCCTDGEVGSLFDKSISEHLRRSRVGRCRAAFLYSAKALRIDTLDGSSLFFINFWSNACRSRPRCAASLSKAHKINGLGHCDAQRALPLRFADRNSKRDASYRD